MYLEKVDQFLSKNYKKPDFYDALTGLISRRYILDYIKYLIDNNIPFYVSMLDIDNFKLVNDNYGHSIGDELLKQFSNNILANLDNKTIAGRLGGDEFIIINVEMTERSKIKEFFNNFYQQKHVVRKEYVINDNSFYITCTAGSASFPKDSTDFFNLLNLVDKALYKGKSKGRNCYVIYDEELHKNININTLNVKKVYDIMNDITDAFVRGRNFEIALKFSLDKVVEVMGFTGAFYLDENLSLIATKHSNIVNITELSWGDIKQIVEDQNMLNLHHIDYMKDVNINVYNYLMRYRVISLLVKKVRFATGNFGYIAFTDSAKSRVWQDKDITILTYIEKLIGIFKIFASTKTTGFPSLIEEVNIASQFVIYLYGLLFLPNKCIFLIFSLAIIDLYSLSLGPSPISKTSKFL